MTATIPDLDALQHLDFDHQPTCEAPDCVGDHGTATHLGAILICSCPPMLLCQPCAVWLVDHYNDWFADPYCLRCGQPGPPNCRLRDFVRVEPLL